MAMSVPVGAPPIPPIPPAPPIPLELDDELLELLLLDTLDAPPPIPPIPPAPAPPNPPAPPVSPLLELLDELLEALLDELLAELVVSEPVPPDELLSSVPVAHPQTNTKKAKDEQGKRMNSMYALGFDAVKRNAVRAIFGGKIVDQGISSSHVNESFTTTQDFGDEQGVARPLPMPFLFVVLQCDEPTRGGARFALYGTDVVTIGRGANREATRSAERDLHLRLPSASVSKEHARLVRREHEWIFQDLNSRNGSCINGQRVTNAVIRDGDWIEVGGVVLRYRASLPALSECATDLELSTDEREIRGYSSLLPAIESSLRSLVRVAKSPITTLLLGETGTGKEVLAAGMHLLSGRTGPFVAVNCGALTSSLLESHLFGHVKGSFTGALRDELGLIRSADAGTLFLDEVGDLPLPTQAALLRVLQEREVLPVGGTRPTSVDVRVIAATNKPLEMLCLQGEFRADLLARLAGYQHALVPLRERVEDLGVLVSDLLHRAPFANAKSLRLHLHVVRRLIAHGWPQNIRELDNMLSVAAALADRGIMEVAHLPESITKSTPKPLPDSDPPSNPGELQAQIRLLLEQHNGNVTLVARAMGKSRMQLHRWMQKFGIDPEEYRG